MKVLLCVGLLASPLHAQALAESGAWTLSRVPDEHYGAGFGCRLTLVAKTARLELTSYFLGADVFVTAQSLAFEPHKETLVLYVPAIEKQMNISGATFDGMTIKARGGEQVLMAMLEETAAAKASQIVVGEGETAFGAFDASGLDGIMPDMRACFDGL